MCTIVESIGEPKIVGLSYDIDFNDSNVIGVKLICGCSKRISLILDLGNYLKHLENANIITILP